MKFILYKDRKGRYRWRLVGKNGKKIAVAGESFTRKRACKKSIVRLCDGATAPVVDTTLKR